MFWRIEISSQEPCHSPLPFLVMMLTTPPPRRCHNAQLPDHVELQYVQYFRRHPGGITTGIALATPALRTELRLLTGLPSIKISVFSGPCREYQSGGYYHADHWWSYRQVNARHGTNDLRYIAGNRVLRISSAVMVETPGACKFCSAR